MSDGDFTTAIAPAVIHPAPQPADRVRRPTGQQRIGPNASCWVAWFLASLVHTATAAADGIDGGPGPSADGLDACVNAATAALAEQGARVAEEAAPQFLRQGQSATRAFTLRRDGCVALFAVGHARALDVDLSVYVEGGIAVGQDVELDAHAYVRYCGAEGLRLYGNVRMFKGQGEVRLLMIENAPVALPDLNRTVGACFASRGGVRRATVDLGPEPAAPDLSWSVAQRSVALATLGYRNHGTEITVRPPRRQSAALPLALDPGRCYAVTAVAGPGVLDVDLAVRDGSGRVVVRDGSRARDGQVRLCADSAGPYVAEPRIFQGDGEVALVTHVLEEPDTRDLPAGVEGLGRVPYAEAVAQLRSRGYAPEPIGWGYLSPGQSLTFPVPLAGQRCHALVVVPAAELVGSNIDLMLRDEAGRVLAWDLGRGSEPMVFHCTESAISARAMTRTYGGRGRYLLILGRSTLPATVPEEREGE